MAGTLRVTPSTTGGYGCCVWDSDPRWTMLKAQDVLESTRISELSQIQAQDTSFDSPGESFPMAAILEIGERGNQTNNNIPSDGKKMYQAYKGQLKLSISVTNGYLSVHVQEARHLSTKSGSSACSSFVEVDMIPKISRRTQCRTHVVEETSHPVYDERFTYELLGRDYQRRILLSVYHTTANTNSNSNTTTKELIGSMSFGIKNMAEKNAKVEGYYFLLADKIGQQKHMKVHSDDQHLPTKSNNTPVKPSSQFRATVPTPGRVVNTTGNKPMVSNTPSDKIPTVRIPAATPACQKRALCATPRSSVCGGQLRSRKRSRKSSQGSSTCSSSSSSGGSDIDSVTNEERLLFPQEQPTQALLSLPIYTTPSDMNYGLHLAQGCPTVVSRVESGSPAARAGLQPGDKVVAINGRPVHDMYPDSVAAVIKYYSRCAVLDVVREVTRRNSRHSVIDLDTAVPVIDAHSFDNDDFFEVTESYKNRIRPDATEHSVIGRREQALSQLSTPAVRRDVVPLVKLSSKKKFFKLF